MMFLNNTSVSKKLIISIGSITGVFLCLALLLVGSLLSVKKSMNNLFTESRTTSLIKNVHMATSDIQMNISKMILTQDQTQREGFKKQNTEIQQRYENSMKELKTLVAAQEDIKLLSEIESLVAPAAICNTKLIELVDASKTTEAATQYTSECTALVDKVSAIVEKFDVQQSEHLKSITTTSSASLSWTMMFVLVGCLIAVIGAIFFISIIARGVAVPLKAVVTQVNEIAKGNITRTLDAQYINRSDEIGMVAQAVEKMKGNLHTIVKDLSSSTTTLSNASNNLSTVSTQITSNSNEMTTLSNSVASASKSSVDTINSMTVAAEQMSANITNIATSIEEMSSSLNEVAKSCQKESAIASTANTQAKSTQGIMEHLGDSAKEIGKVIEVINSIADQTNLLALNATIEAASAGDAGKGFAVVANEVKELAKQTAQATGEISKKISEMQANTNDAIKAIKDITGIIEEINTISQTIVSAVEEQSATVNEISKNIGSTSAAAGDIAKNVSNSAEGLTEVSSKINTVNK
ncbi:MAG: HAMP domain-containing protein, partial [Chitinivibrionales bacterium]|nr:HAMP domain-containing protein [Chitinivibrionales bacterium]